MARQKSGCRLGTSTHSDDDHERARTLHSTAERRRAHAWPSCVRGRGPKSGAGGDKSGRTKVEEDRRRRQQAERAPTVTDECRLEEAGTDERDPRSHEQRRKKEGSDRKRARNKEKKREKSRTTRNVEGRGAASAEGRSSVGGAWIRSAPYGLHLRSFSSMAVFLLWSRFSGALAFVGDCASAPGRLGLPSPSATAWRLGRSKSGIARAF